ATQKPSRRQAAARRAAATRKRNAANRSAAATKASARRTRSSASRTSRDARRTSQQAARTATRRADEATTRLGAVGRQAQRALLIPVGAAAIASDKVRETARTYTKLSRVTRELDKFERRGRRTLHRRRRGRGFTYTREDGRPVTDREVLGRLRELAVPPAWQDVWICPDPQGHLQATGIDAAGRKQYLYHPLWREHRDRLKFARMA